ncbi:MAG: serine/threonine-protein phosphatase [Acidimicrobiia bacterium]|nr:serine/threonine-protein phosphatase [Acidimicrobiia bacterium]
MPTLQKDKPDTARKFLWASGTHIGQFREQNQDLIYPEHDGQDYGPLLVAVADGCGGLPHGDWASSLAIQEAIAAKGTVKDRVLAANKAVFSKKVGMATTLTIVELLPDGTANIGHLGDSRAYLFREGKLYQITRDHTVGHALIWAVGYRRSPRVDVLQLKLANGDRLLLCSDGLTCMLTDTQIADIVKSGTPLEVVENLIEAANKAGGYDNISVVLVDA